MTTAGKRPLVRVILTEFVQTDPQNFKATVQNLTGKDAPVRGCRTKRPARNGRTLTGLHERAGEEQFMMRANEGHTNGVGVDVGPVKKETENWTADEFRWLLELPPLDEQAVWAQMRP